MPSLFYAAAFLNISLPNDGSDGGVCGSAARAYLRDIYESPILRYIKDRFKNELFKTFIALMVKSYLARIFFSFYFRSDISFTTFVYLSIAYLTISLSLGLALNRSDPSSFNFSTDMINYSISSISFGSSFAGSFFGLTSFTDGETDFDFSGLFSSDLRCFSSSSVK